MINLSDYGYQDIFERQITENEQQTGLIPARVTSIQKENYQVVSAYGNNNAKLKGSLFYLDSKFVTYPAVGDFVLIKPNYQGDDIIYRVLERRTCFSRLNPSQPNAVNGSSAQIVASNFDYVFVMLSLNYDFNVRRAERYVAAAWQSGGIPIVVLTKQDLCIDYEEKAALLQSALPGIDIHVISAHTGFGIENLQKYLKPAHTLVFMGSSGIGKSSLINVLSGNVLMKVNSIREEDSKGRHTTTYRQLFRLENGVLLIDTPGMRELGIWDAEEGISETFADIEDLTSSCRFHNCRHQEEPGCAVKEAIQNGSLTNERWSSYLKLLKEARRSARKAAMLKSKKETTKTREKHVNYNKEEWY
ncbi:putative ribosome biogenesis GTPase RsgA [Anaerocolumna cellulosilytica]|uniref:Small ribosomal subunit biogenesis GTPase RsgA n=1 Tax=Anaerocolumna cellulosilytica TaxID=433286 RepID=A0A6S6R8X7_9FIRM|nr:ribosome small subunit-dependent GTPase A [Anaerocolumna cellulosilytica]MBB5196755.1 ribosome biogenesis GTPase [Anaerocolumna cellulosilytica]BCJ95850.1 putative ribosome biogenesis GTPase RsgA [Anaerocolumna cellulosilytica]